MSPVCFKNLESRSVVVHVGLHRTGSTSLQTWLAFLQKNGFTDGRLFYPLSTANPETGEYGHNALMDVSAQCWSESLVRMLDREIGEMIGGQPIIISAEELSRVPADELRGVINSEDVTIILFERERYEWVGSIWSLVTARGQNAHPPYEFFVGAFEDILKCRESGQVSFYDVPKKLERYRGVFGWDKVKVLSYDAKEAVPRFLKAVFPQGYPAEWRVGFPSVNQSSSVERVRAEFFTGRTDCSGAELANRVAHLSELSGSPFPVSNENLLRLISIE
jgi:hypothetical protein